MIDNADWRTARELRKLVDDKNTLQEELILTDKTEVLFKKQHARQKGY